MEKASTPKNRLTRSTAKQVNTPKTVDQEESLNTAEDLKHNLRKSRRKAETKPKTNGDTSSMDGKTMKNIEDVSDGNSLDGCESEDSNRSANQKMSPKTSNQKTPPTISRKSLRSRRSITPGPELESSASRKMKRSTSEGKLETISTPRRGARAKSESKDFVFTPSKCKTNGKDTVSSLSESNSKYIHKKSPVRVIDRIDETNEEDSSHEELEQKHQRGSLKSSNLLKKVDLEETIINSDEKLSDASAKDFCSILELESVNHKETENKTDSVNSNVEESIKEDRGISQGSKTSPQNLKEAAGSPSQEPKVLPEGNIPLSEAPIAFQCDNKDQEPSCIEVEDKTVSNTNVSEEPIAPVLEKSTAFESEKLLNSEVTKIDEINSKSPASSDMIDPKPSDNDSKELIPSSSPEDCQTITPKEKDTKVEIEEIPPIMQSDNTAVSENNNVRLVPEQSDVVGVLNQEENLMDSEEVDVIPETVTSPVDEDEEAVDVDSEPLVISESESAEPIDETEMDQVKENIETTDTIKENVVSMQHECAESEERDIRGKTDAEDDHSVEVNAKQKVVNLQEEVVIEDSENSLGNENVENQTNYLDTKIDDERACDIQVENPQAIIGTEKTVVIEFSLLKNEKSPNTVLIQETKKTEIMDEYGKEEFVETNENTMLIQLNDQVETEIEPNLMTDNQCEPQLEDNFNGDNYIEGNFNKHEEDNFEEDNLNKNEEDSASDCDIYKGLSDFGTDGEEKKDGSQYGDSVSTEVRSVDSEEDISSVDEEEDEENVEDLEEENLASDPPKDLQNDQKNIQENDSKVCEKMLDTSTTPMTYDRALAILNKDRVKKIDDEEFFDMFTQELNRVSEESGSDSDIAIVDEYILEPEEPVKKPNPKTGSPLAKLKPAQNPRPSVSSQHMPPTGSFSGQYNEQVPPLQSRSGIPRSDYSQGRLYHQYNQGMPPGEPIEGPAMYSQFAPHAPGIPDPRMYHPHVPPDGNFRTGMYNHPLAHVTDGPIRYANSPGSKVRHLSTANSSQYFINPNYNYPEHDVSNVVEINTSGDPNEQEGNMEDNMRKSAAAVTDNNDLSLRLMDQDASRFSVPKTPILDLLGLDTEKLKLLKKALGIEKESKKPIHKKKLIEHLKKQKFTPSKKSPSLKRLKKADEKRRRKEREQAHTKVVKIPVLKHLLLKKILSDPGLQNSIFGSTSEHSSAESALSSESFLNASSSESENRKVNIEDGSFLVTINTGTRKPRHRAWKHFARVLSSSDDSTTRLRMKKKQKKNKRFDDCLSNQSSDAGTRKMTQGKKQNKKQSTIIKSNCGTFTVDPLPTSQSSDSELQSQDEQVAAPSASMQQLRRSIKKDMASDKNRLSNLFRQHSSSQQSKKSSKRKAEEAFGDSDKLLKKERERVRKLKKLPTELLEQLVNEGMTKGSPTSDSEEETTTKPRKSRKRAKKMRVKSAVADQDYIPCVTSGATQFGLSRLDRAGAQGIAERAARYRTDHLYGADVKRITSKELKNIKEKQKMSMTLSKKMRKEPK